ncbi:MAG TPA: pyridoxamine 5'-phosphate oxidase family protein [Streptosporangiaceae bacterium]|nr:pyridoxamine 5'-phosphate oxidase family protein [Streptosporangiaceae bacterium]
MSYERRMEELTRPESMELLGAIPVGRIVFTHHALPAIRPVNHLVAGDHIIVRATDGAAITALAEYRGMVVAYEADAFDPVRRLGWSVIVIGTARQVTDPVDAARYRSQLDPWIAGPTDDVISISTEIVHGYRLVPGDLFVAADGATAGPAQ